MQELLKTIARLRQECPWDKKQTPESLTRYAIEEAYEVEDAVRSGNVEDIKAELGDLLLQVVFQAQMYSEQNAFNFDDVVKTLNEKLIRRHPHVFGDEQAHTQAEVEALWQQTKAQEQPQKSRLSTVKHAPSLLQAQAIQKNVAEIGFDFPTVEEAMDKFDEEWQELKYALTHQTQKEVEDEFGDCLFSLVNIGRKLNVSSEQALLGTIHKFRQRFAYIEQHMTDKMSLKQMDKLWDEAKQHGL